MNDWKLREFEDCIERVTYPPKVQRKNFLNEGTFPIISQEQNFINGYWNDASAVFEVKKPIIIFGDHTQVVKYIDFDFVLGADGVKILQPTDDIYPRYFYYFLQSVELRSLGYARHYRLLKDVSVPVPPFDQQKRIVAILDEAFEAIDKAKQNAKKNLQNARELFDTHLKTMFLDRDTQWIDTTVGDQITLQRGFDITKNQQLRGNVPVISSGGIKSFHNIAMAKGPGVVIGRKGTLGKVYYSAVDFWPHDTTLWVKDFKGNEPNLSITFLGIWTLLI